MGLPNFVFTRSRTFAAFWDEIELKARIERSAYGLPGQMFCGLATQWTNTPTFGVNPRIK
jgi:hypothetical protein